MSYAAHRNGDSRTCGAATTVNGQTTVFVNNRLWAVAGDTNTHGSGGLIPTGSTIFVEGKLVIVHSPDPAFADDLCPIEGEPHCSPFTSQGSSDTVAY